MSTLADAFIGHEEKYRAAVMRETWGHLAPKPRHGYQGWLVFAWAGCGSHLVIVDFDFDDLESSPWTFEDMHEYINRLIDEDNIQRGNVYRFEGTYTKFKNGKCRFSGRVRRIDISSRFVS